MVSIQPDTDPQHRFLLHIFCDKFEIVSLYKIPKYLLLAIENMMYIIKTFIFCSTNRDLAT
jgi:hypothetical protein